MSGPDVSKLLEQAQRMQSKMAELQQELATRSFEGSSGGGMVTVEATGGLRVTRISVEPELLDGGDREMMQDLIAAAVNAALGNAQRGVQEEFQRLTGGMGIPGLGAGPE